MFFNKLCFFGGYCAGCADVAPIIYANRVGSYENAPANIAL
jgi:hypothetical protein